MGRSSVDLTPLPRTTPTLDLLLSVVSKHQTKEICEEFYENAVFLTLHQSEAFSRSFRQALERENQREREKIRERELEIENQRENQRKRHSMSLAHTFHITSTYIPYH